MIRFLFSMGGLTLIAIIAAAVTWQIVGPPDRSVPCQVSDLKEGEVCLETVLGWGSDQVLWIDARKRPEWEKNGVEGSLLFNDQKEEDLADLDEAFMNVQALEPRANVVIYCDTEKCGTSKTVAKHLRQEFAEVLGFKVWVLYGGWKALADEGLTR